MTDKLENQGGKNVPKLSVINIVLLIGLIVLYILHFSSVKNTKTVENIPQQKEMPSEFPRIAFIDSDVLMDQYEMVSSMVTKFENSTKGKEAVIREKQSSLERRYTDLQQRVQSGSISLEIAQITEEQLIKEQQELMMLRDELSEQLSKEEYEMNLELYDIVSRFLEEYNQIHNYDLIFNFKKGNNYFIANHAYDITPEVVELLNQDYRLKQPRK
ncbi:MAG: OmpH family outer membrane protein [Bacteroidales bacterium]|jgi:Skp family chaperone for outer membrane proteins|nr:OmpH family outer membrane protein [Bacteroidales bacterium]